LAILTGLVVVLHCFAQRNLGEERDSEAFLEGAEIVDEKTLIILKPDCTQRRLIGRIVQRFEDKGLRLAGMKLMQISQELAERHYSPHTGKPFYPGLIEYITSGPVVVLVVAGPGAIAISRKMMGKTFGFEAEPGTIRGDFGASKTFNLIHGSDSPESAATEIGLYFKADELLNYQVVSDGWVFKPGES
jgi:nucleoside-diphosphate kinase